MHGIYKLDIASDQTKQLTYCLATPGDQRPDNFTTPDGSRRMLIRLKLLDDVVNQNWAKPTGFSIMSSVVEHQPTLTGGAKLWSGPELLQLEKVFEPESGGQLLNVAGLSDVKFTNDWLNDASMTIPGTRLLYQ